MSWTFRFGVVWFLFWVVWSPLEGLAAESGEWIAFFNHFHTRYSHDNRGAERVKLTVESVLKRTDRVARSMGVSGAVAITDHNNHDATGDPAFRPVGVIRPIKGEEWGGPGHAGVLGYSGDTAIARLIPPQSPETYVRMVTRAHSLGGIVIANHPRSSIKWQTDRRFGVDAVEVWSMCGWKGSDKSALAWWHRLLVAGERLTAVGGTDAHFYFQSVEFPLNWVFAESNAPEDVLAAVKAGRVQILSGPSAPRILLRADFDGDGVYDDALSGDALMVDRNRAVRFEVVLEKAIPAHHLLLLDKEGEFFSGGVGVGPGWNRGVYRFERTFRASERNFVRAELRRGNTHIMECLCNPIYLIGKNAPATTEVQITGMVTTAGGQPVANALVRLAPGEFSHTCSDQTGAYRIIAPKGRYKLHVSAGGVAPISIPVSGFEEQMTLDVRLSPSR